VSRAHQRSESMTGCDALAMLGRFSVVDYNTGRSLRPQVAGARLSRSRRPHPVNRVGGAGIDGVSWDPAKILADLFDV
jgi:hypothetical protein